MLFSNFLQQFTTPHNLLLLIAQSGEAIHPLRMIYMYNYFVNPCIIKHWLHTLSEGVYTNNLKGNMTILSLREGLSILWIFLWNTRKVIHEEIYNISWILGNVKLKVCFLFKFPIFKATFNRFGQNLLNDWSVSCYSKQLRFELFVLTQISHYKNIWVVKKTHYNY